MDSYYSDQDKRNDKLIGILRELGDFELQQKLRLSDICDNYVNSFKKIYFDGMESGKKFRHSYSRIYQFIYDELYEEKNDPSILDENINWLYKYCSKNNELEIAEALYKLMDHIEMDIVRISNLRNQVDGLRDDIDLLYDDTKKLMDNSNRLDESYKKYDEQSSELNRKIKKFQKTKSKIDKIDEQVENSYSQFISILGIFAGIVIVFFGGASVFSGFYAGLSEVKSLTVIAFTLSLTGLILFDIIFLFFYILAKLVKSDIATSKAKNIKGNKRLLMRYPYFFIFNIMMIAIIIVCLGVEHFD